MRRFPKAVAWLILAVAVAAGVFFGVRLLGPGERAAGDSDAVTRQPAKIRYHCPMHPTVITDHPGSCPICGMQMVPLEEQPPSSGGGAAQSTPGKKVFYRSSMNPSEVSDRPGKDSMGMEMERVEVEEDSGGEAVEGLATVHVPDRKRQLIGVRTEPVGPVRFVRTLQAVGRVTVDEARIHHLHTKVEGWVERLLVNATGERVRRGQTLLTIYSPELLATQEEHLLALRARQALGPDAPPDAIRRADGLLGSSRRRLLLYDLAPTLVDELERAGMPMKEVPFRSPIPGYVLQRNVTQGERITPDSNLLDIADLSRVWVLASVYEYEVPFVHVGQEATMSLAYQPGKTYRGRVDLIYPVLEASSRTVQVRLEFANPEMELKPEMFAEVRIEADLGSRLAAPESAILSTGTRDLVFVEVGEGTFEPREVTLGVRMPDTAEVLAGLKEGERVVTSGNFLLDSESKLKAALKEAAGRSSRAPQTRPQSATAPSGERR
ncbi:MAG TPA: efflux RND transporter periplasmic adaptor subunit [Candidatus Polarisedimenticolia bacterium]|nr:efflux RND transporter periplasmic adaptor subunit [Candidatus Polarisedimenticolia bacterium]